MVKKRKYIILTKFLLFIISTVLISCKPKFSSLSKVDNYYNLTTEYDLEKSHNYKKIENFYNSGKNGVFSGKEGISIYYGIYDHPSSEKAILISSGRTEAALKYKELIYDLYNNGYAIYIHDHRGQGQSGRLTKDPEMGYIDSFQYYIDDMKYFYNQFLKPKNYKKKYLLAHSMGGAIGITYLEQYPEDFQAAAFSSPMLGLKPGICSIVNVLNGNKPKYAIGESKYKDSKSSFVNNTLTGSKIRYDRMIDAFNDIPEAKLGGATYDWVNKSCKQFKYIFNNIDKLSIPIILFSAENEQIVYPYAHKKFINKAKELSKECEAYIVENAQHELLIEKDEQRIETINKTLNFYSKY